MSKYKTIIHYRKTDHRWNRIHASNSKDKGVQVEEISIKRNYENKTAYIAYVGPKCKIKLDTKDKIWT